jgi:hypothetical protein
MQKSLAAIALLVVACNKPSAPPPSPPIPAPRVPVGAAPGSPPLGDPSVDSRAVDEAQTLTDAKVVAYIAYLKAMPKGAKPVTGVGMTRFARQNPAQLESANDLALAASGLSQEEVAGLTQLTSAYNRAGALTIMMLNEQLEATRKKIADAKAQGKAPSALDTGMEKAFSANLAKEQAQRVERMKDFVGIYGQAAVDILDRHQTEYQAVVQGAAQQAAAQPDPSGPAVSVGHPSPSSSLTRPAQ